jgi:hypothetical protein
VTTFLGIVLALVVLWAISFYQFAPFRLRIIPLSTLLTDHGLATKEQLHTLAATDDSVLVRGIRFTVLRVGWQSSDGNLIYWEDHHSFTTRIDWDFEIKELAFSAPDAFRMLGVKTVSPALYRLTIMRRRSRRVRLRVTSIDDGTHRGPIPRHCAHVAPLILSGSTRGAPRLPSRCSALTRP